MGKKKQPKTSCLICGTNYNPNRYSSCPTCQQERINKVFKELKR